MKKNFKQNFKYLYDVSVNIHVGGTTMMKDGFYERKIFMIRCGDGHESELRLGADYKFPKVIKCPKTIDGQPCEKECEMVKVLKEVVKGKPPKMPTISKKQVEESSEYNLSNFFEKTTQSIAKLLQNSHDYCIEKGLKPHYRKHYIVYTMGRKTVMRLGVGKNFMSMPYNSEEDPDDERVKDISHTQGDTFSWFWTRIEEKDFETVKNKIDEVIKYSR